MTEQSFTLPIDPTLNKNHPTLFCLPSVGGSAAMFKKWKKNIKDIQIVPVEYPGRGVRSAEPFPDDVQSLAKQIAHLIIATDIINFSLFGHSIGALISWELSLELQRQNYPLPQYLWASSRKAPHFTPAMERRSELNDKALIHLIKSMGGTPNKLLDKPSFQASILPIIRADFKLHDDYFFTLRHSTRPVLPVSIIALGGESDEQVSYDTISQWCSYTSESFEQFEFQGGHFYLQDPAFLDWFQNKINSLKRLSRLSSPLPSPVFE